MPRNRNSSRNDGKKKVQINKIQLFFFYVFKRRIVFRKRDVFFVIVCQHFVNSTLRRIKQRLTTDRLFKKTTITRILITSSSPVFGVVNRITRQIHIVFAYIQQVFGPIFVVALRFENRSFYRCTDNTSALGI